MNIIKSLWALLWCAACTWLALWAANIGNYILSLPFSFFGIALEHARGVVEFIYIFITTGIAYLLTFFNLFATAFNKNVISDSPVMGRICLGLIIACVIIICDERIHPSLPYFLADMIDYIQSEWNYYILSTVNWSDMDFSGENVSDMQYTVFDLVVAVSGLGVLIIGGYDD